MKTRDATLVMDEIEKRVDASSGDLNERNRRYVEFYLQTMGKDRNSSKAKPYGAKVNSQHTHTQILTSCAFVQSGLFPTYPYVYANMQTPYQELNTRATEEFSARLTKMNFYRKTYLWLRMSCMTGLGIVRMGFNDNGPSMHLVHPGNVMWDQTAENLRRDCQWLIEINKSKTHSMLLAEAKAGLYDMAAVEKVLNNDPERDVIDSMRNARSGGIREYPDNTDKPLTIHIQTTPDYIAEVHYESRTVLSIKGNPFGYINYYDLVARPELFEIEGYSIPELGADLQDEIDTLRRQRIDVRSLAANPMFRLVRGSLDPFSIVSAPGAVYNVNNPDDLTQLPVMDNSASLQSEEGLLTSDFDRLVGVMPQTRGEAGAASMKATTASIIHGNTNVRFAVDINLLLDYPMRDFLADFVRWSELVETPLRITQPEWQMIRQLAGSGVITLAPTIESYVGNAVEKFNMLQQFLANIMPTGLLQAPGVAEIAKDMLALVQVQSPERITQYITQPPPVAPAQSQQPEQMDGQPGRRAALSEELARGVAPMQMGGGGIGEVPPA